jgi:predicted site-specific integrase-resolvase
MKNNEYKSQEELLAEILKQLESIAQKLPADNSAAAQLGVIDNADLVQLLKITPRTAITWRKKKLLPHIKIGGKIFYRINDIETMLNKKLNNPNS